MGKLMSFNLFGKGRSLRWAITITCQIAFIFFGYDQGVFSGIVTNTNWQDTFGNPSPSLEGSIVSIYNVGAFFGCGLAFLGGEKMGRRLSIWVSMGFIVRSFLCTRDESLADSSVRLLEQSCRLPPIPSHKFLSHDSSLVSELGECC